MRIKLNEKGDANEKQSKKTGDQKKNGKTKWCHICDKDTHHTKHCYSLPQNKPNNPRYKGKSEEGSKNVNYQAADADDIPPICCPRCMTWGQTLKAALIRISKEQYACTVALVTTNRRTAPERTRRPTYLVVLQTMKKTMTNICMRSEKKTYTKQADTDFLNPKKEKDRFIATREAIEAAAKEAQAK
eukprot:Gb_35307 [translate_table: standard]